MYPADAELARIAAALRETVVAAEEEVWNATKVNAQAEAVAKAQAGDKMSHATSTDNVLTAKELSERDVTVEDASVVDTLAKVSCLVFAAGVRGQRGGPSTESAGALRKHAWL
jgi:hypothetical protein